MIEINLQVSPGAARTEVGGSHGDALRVRVAVPAERGRANEAVVAAVAAALGLRRHQVTMVAGRRGRAKRVRLDVDAEQVDVVRERISELRGRSD